MRAGCLRSLGCLTQDEHISQRMSISGECEAWIYKQSQEFFPQGQTSGKKMSGLLLAGSDTNLWPVFDREPGLVLMLYKKKD